MNNQEQRQREQHQREVRNVTKPEDKPAGPKSVNEPAARAVPPDQLPHSINEPPGSDVTPPTEPEVPPAPDPIDLTALDPESIVVGSVADFLLTVTGTGFTDGCVIVFDDEEQPTTFVDATTLTATILVAMAADTVDVEVHRGEEMSDVLTFEFTAIGVRAAGRAVQRKPKKPEPVSKRTKKSRR
jgi:IPT/TIG domain